MGLPVDINPLKPVTSLNFFCDPSMLLSYLKCYVNEYIGLPAASRTAVNRLPRYCKTHYMVPGKG